MVNSNFERFQKNLAPAIRPRLDPDFVERVADVDNWEKLFRVAYKATENFPFLHIVLDAGNHSSIHEVKEMLGKTPPTRPTHYWWILPLDRDMNLLSTYVQEGFPNMAENSSVQIVSPLSVSFHGGLDDIVILLPPEDLSERRYRWKDYIESSWILVVWGDTQKSLLQEIKADIEQQASQNRHTPWLFESSATVS